ncbi:MAG: double zinc ribbon domain-containing protein [Odoribacter sp.]
MFVVESVGKRKSGIRAALWDLFFPQVCEVCGKSLIKGEKYICTACLGNIFLLQKKHI